MGAINTAKDIHLDFSLQQDTRLVIKLENGFSVYLCNTDGLGDGYVSQVLINADYDKHPATKPVSVTLSVDHMKVCVPFLKPVLHQV